MGYVLFCAIFLLVVLFAITLLPYLLPIFLVIFLFSLFKKPSVRVYTNTFSFNDAPRGFQSRQERKTQEIPVRQPRKDSIDVEFTEREYAEDAE